mgnify:CR=1 FL=1
MFSLQGNPFVNPAGKAANHLFYRKTQPSQADGGTVYAVTVGAGTVNNKQRLAWIPSHALLSEGTRGNTDRAGDMRFCKGFTISDIDQHIVDIACFLALMDIGAIGFKR